MQRWCDGVQIVIDFIQRRENNFTVQKEIGECVCERAHAFCLLLLCSSV